MNNACGKDVLLESVNIFWVSKRCVVVGGWSINILRHLSHKQTNEREEFLNVQSSVLSKFGVEIPKPKEADFTRYSTGSTLCYRYRFLLCMYTFALIF